MKKDIVKLIKAFDAYLDRAYDGGFYDPTNEEDAKYDMLVNKMLKKYVLEK